MAGNKLLTAQINLAYSDSNYLSADLDSKLDHLSHPALYIGNNALRQLNEELGQQMLENSPEHCALPRCRSLRSPINSTRPRSRTFYPRQFDASVDRTAAELARQRKRVRTPHGSVMLNSNTFNVYLVSSESRQIMESKS
ncbi:hypothetical protein [Pseudomonas glycinae]|uniref:hypothetical protein n=1 Tax=Pseudomonas glycinae TaxID=1785145 RepID=UPI00167DE568|nr:hypothetical protein [Pseudomonas glycinae]